MSTVVLRIPARSEYLLLARLALSGVSRAAAIDPETLADLKLAVTEGCANAVRHAYPDDGGLVSVAYSLTGDALEVVIEDDGRGFAPDDVSAWTPEELDEDGMGLAIIESVVDELQIETGARGRGTRLRFVKRLAA